jgi:hypothetical protein
VALIVGLIVGNLFRGWSRPPEIRPVVHQDHRDPRGFGVTAADSWARGSRHVPRPVRDIEIYLIYWASFTSSRAGFGLSREWAPLAWHLICGVRRHRHRARPIVPTPSSSWCSRAWSS